MSPPSWINPWNWIFPRMNNAKNGGTRFRVPRLFFTGTALILRYVTASPKGAWQSPDKHFRFVKSEKTHILGLVSYFSCIQTENCTGRLPRRCAPRNDMVVGSRQRRTSLLPRKVFFNYVSFKMLSRNFLTWRRFFRMITFFPLKFASQQ